MKTMQDYWQYDDERPYLHMAHVAKLDDAARIEYAAIVERRDPDRAEWLRLEMQLHSDGVKDPAVLARFLALGRQIGMELANLLLRETILNCGDGMQESPRVRFAYRCPKRWNTLLATDTDGVRHCQHCNERVYLCEDVKTAANRALAGQCIAIRKELSDGGVESLMLGRPDPVEIWADHLFPDSRR